MPTATEFFRNHLVRLTALPECVEDKCLICLGNLTEPCQTPCNHLYCKACLIDGWLVGDGKDTHNTCPTCRCVFFTLPVQETLPLLDLLSNHTEVDLARATVAATQHLEELPTTPANTEQLLVNAEFLGARLYAMDNVMRERYHGVEREPRASVYHHTFDHTWLSRRMHAILRDLDGFTGDDYRVCNLEPWLRRSILEELEASGVAVGTALIYGPDAIADVNLSDVDMLTRYIVCQCSRAYSEKQMRSQWTSLQTGGETHCD